MKEVNDRKVPAVRIDPALDKYAGVSLSPEKLKKANAQIEKIRFPPFAGKERGEFLEK